MRLFISLFLAASTLLLAACGGGSFSVVRGETLDIEPHFVHVTGAATLTDADMRSRIDHPMLDANPNAILIATYTQNARGSVFGNRFESAFAVEYVELVGKWYIRSLDGPIPRTAGFNISIFGASPTSFVQTTNAGNISSDLTRMSNPSIDNEPNAKILTTMRINGSVPSMSELNPALTGLYYSAGTGLWGIYNQDDSPMAENVAFNVHVVTVPTAEFHTSIAANISGDTNWIPSSMTDELPNAFIHLAHYYTIDRLNKQIGLNYRHIALWSTNRWGVTLQDGTAMPEDMRFLVARFQ